jgi:hypothetical protein
MTNTIIFALILILAIIAAYNEEIGAFFKTIWKDWFGK